MLTFPKGGCAPDTRMGSLCYTVAFEGVEARLVEVQCAVTPGLPGFSIVGLPDKSVSEARDRVRSALTALSVALPAKRITVNLSPADLRKEGSHFDLPIALALLAALGALPRDAVSGCMALGELSLDGTLIPVAGALPAAVTAAASDKTLICPGSAAAEAAWVGSAHVIGVGGLLDVMGHLSGQTPLAHSTPGPTAQPRAGLDLRDVRGQERAKRALEIAAAGRHHLLMVGAPGSGKSMLAARLPGLLPPMSARAALETSMVHSVAGLLKDGALLTQPPMRDPHHTASMPAMVGGGRGAKPGEISLAHNGVLFLDELPEFQRPVLDTLRQPLETGTVMVSRANAHVSYPSRVLLVAAANPCRCGYLSEADRACSRAPHCGQEYMARLSGPLMDRFDLRIEVPPVQLQDMHLPASGPASADVSARVATARAVQAERYAQDNGVETNADVSGDRLQDVLGLTPESQAMLIKAAERFHLSARGYHRVMRVARTIADLAGAQTVTTSHLAEALSFRLVTPRSDSRTGFRPGSHSGQG